MANREKDAKRKRNEAHAEAIKRKRADKAKPKVKGKRSPNSGWAAVLHEFRKGDAQ